MTITLTPDTEAQVRSAAEIYGVSPEEAFIMLLDWALTRAEKENQSGARTQTDKHTSS